MAAIVGNPVHLSGGQIFVQNIQNSNFYIEVRKRFFSGEEEAVSCYTFSEVWLPLRNPSIFARDMASLFRVRPDSFSVCLPLSHRQHRGAFESWSII